MANYQEVMGDYYHQRVQEHFLEQTRNTRVSVEILVYPKEDVEVDYYKNRHVGLYFKFCAYSTGDEETILAGALHHVKAMTGVDDFVRDKYGNFVRPFFEWEEKFPYDPEGSSRVARGGRVNLGWLEDGLTKEDIADLMSQVHIDNEVPDVEFNCQQWVWNAVQFLHANNWMRDDQVEDALSGMVNLIAEAEGEDSAPA